MSEKKAHKHADLLRAIALGNDIEFKTMDSFQNWFGVGNNHALRWYCQTRQDFEWRVKPEPKPDVIRQMFVEVHPKLDSAYNKPNLRLTFDGETHKLKHAEVLNAEE